MKCMVTAGLVLSLLFLAACGEKTEPTKPDDAGQPAKTLPETPAPAPENPTPSEPPADASGTATVVLTVDGMS